MDSCPEGIGLKWPIGKRELSRWLLCSRTKTLVRKDFSLTSQYDRQEGQTGHVDGGQEGQEGRESQEGREGQEGQDGQEIQEGQESLEGQ